MQQKLFMARRFGEEAAVFLCGSGRDPLVHRRTWTLSALVVVQRSTCSSVPTQNLWSATTDRANIALCGTQTRGKWEKNLEEGPYQATIASLDASLTR